MTRLPQIESELVAAAERLHGSGPRRVAPAARRLVPALVVAAIAAVAVIAFGTLRSGDDERTAAPPAGVPATTLALSSRLAGAPDAPPSGRLNPDALRENRIAQGEMAAVIAELQRSTPYPPGHADTVPANGVAFRNDVQALVEFRAACLWMQYWLDSGGDARADAAAVMADIPAWPTVRSDLAEPYRALADAARAGDAAPIRRDVDRNCQGVGQ